MARVCICCKYRVNKLVSDVSLYGFPKDDDLVKKWLLAIGTEKKVSESSRICSRHFKEDDFRYSLVGGKRLLKRGAIPSLHLTGESKDDQLSNSQDVIAKENQAVDTGDDCVIKTESKPLSIAESRVENKKNNQLSYIDGLKEETTSGNIGENIQSYECYNESQVSGRISPSVPDPNEPAKKHKRYLYDVRWEEISTSPVQAKIYWEVAIKKVKRQKAFLRVLQQKVKRLKKTILDLQTRVSQAANTESQ